MTPLKRRLLLADIWVAKKQPLLFIGVCLLTSLSVYMTSNVQTQRNPRLPAVTAELSFEVVPKIGGGISKLYFVVWTQIAYNSVC